MLFGLLVLITALTISGVAIYYSVAGLVAIFAAAAVPIIQLRNCLKMRVLSIIYTGILLPGMRINGRPMPEWV